MDPSANIPADNFATTRALFRRSRVVERQESVHRVASSSRSAFPIIPNTLPQWRHQATCLPELATREPLQNAFEDDASDRWAPAKPIWPKTTTPRWMPTAFSLLCAGETCSIHVHIGSRAKK